MNNTSETINVQLIGNLSFNTAQQVNQTGFTLNQPDASIRFRNGATVIGRDSIGTTNLDVDTINGQPISFGQTGPTGPAGSGGGGGIGVTGTCYGDYLYWNPTGNHWDVGSSDINIGCNAGASNQQTLAVAIGREAGRLQQGTASIGIGYQAGQSTQGENAIGIGYTAGANSQESEAIAMGFESGLNQQGSDAIAIGTFAGRNTQGRGAIGIGSTAGEINQARTAVAVGNVAGRMYQGTGAVAIGVLAGQSTQGANAIGIGNNAGSISQGSGAIATGFRSGLFQQGSNSIAIGSYAGQTSQPSNSVVINASGSALNGATSGATYINPIRSATFSNIMGYDTITSEVSYQSASILKNINLSTIFGSIVDNNYTLPSDIFHLYNKDIATTGTNYTYSTLSTGLTTTCSILAIDGNGNIYAGGNFTSSGTNIIYGIARWDTTISKWVALGNTTTTSATNTIFGISFDSSNNVYAGGSFTSIGGVSASNIAKWDISTSTWSALGSGTNGNVNEITIDKTNNILYAGGAFTTAGGITVNRIAQYNITTSTWSGLGAGLSGNCNYITLDSTTNTLYAGGAFATISGGITVNRIAKWDIATSVWSALGSDANVGVGTTNVNAILVAGTLVYVGGDFTTAGGSSVSASRLAIWDTITSTWSAWGGGIGGSAWCFSLAKDDSNNIYVGTDSDGTFTGLPIATRFAKWNSDSSTWSYPGGITSSFNLGRITTILPTGSDIYLGGTFTTIGTVVVNAVALLTNNFVNLNYKSQVLATITDGNKTVAVSTSPDIGVSFGLNNFTA